MRVWGGEMQAAGDQGGLALIKRFHSIKQLFPCTVFCHQLRDSDFHGASQMVMAVHIPRGCL